VSAPHDWPAPRLLYAGDYCGFSPFDRAALAALREKLPRRALNVLEVGSWLGNGSTEVLIGAVREAGGALTCVDTWRGTPNVARHREIAAQYDVFGTFTAAVVRAGGAGLVRPLVATSLDAARRLAGETFDLVFLDADHSYAATRADIAAWRGRVAPGGILCGHDCEIRPTAANRALLEAARDRDAVDGAAVGAPQFRNVHAGVVLAVDEAFAGGATLCGDALMTLPTGAVGRATLWYVRA
jgi:predicted O-methyltransferase YrrM